MAARLVSKRAQKHRADEGERSERQNHVDAQSWRDGHVVTREVSTWQCVLGERQVSY